MRRTSLVLSPSMVMRKTLLDEVPSQPNSGNPNSKEESHQAKSGDQSELEDDPEKKRRTEEQEDQSGTDEENTSEGLGKEGKDSSVGDHQLRQIAHALLFLTGDETHREDAMTLPRRRGEKESESVVDRVREQLQSLVEKKNLGLSPSMSQTLEPVLTNGMEDQETISPIISASIGFVAAEDSSRRHRHLQDPPPVPDLGLQDPPREIGIA